MDFGRVTSSSGPNLIESNKTPKPPTGLQHQSTATKRRAEDETPGYPSTIKKVCRHVSSAISSGIAAVVEPFLPLATQHTVARETHLWQRLSKSRVSGLRQTSYPSHRDLRTQSIQSASLWTRGVSENRFAVPPSTPSLATLARHAEDRVMDSRYGSSRRSTFITTSTVGKRKRDIADTVNMEIVKRAYNSFARSPWAGESWTSNNQVVKGEKYDPSSRQDEQLPTPDGTPTPDPDRARRSLSPSRSPIARDRTHRAYKPSHATSRIGKQSNSRDLSEVDAATGLAFDYRNTTPESEDERPYIQRILRPKESKSRHKKEDRDEIIEIDDSESGEPAKLLKSVPSSEPIRPVLKQAVIDLPTDGREYEIKNDPVWLILSPPPPLDTRTRRRRQEEEDRAQARRHKEKLVEAEKRRGSQELQVDLKCEPETTPDFEPLRGDKVVAIPKQEEETENKVQEDLGNLKLEVQDTEKTSTTKAVADTQKYDSYRTPKSKFFEVELTVKKTRRAEQLAQIEAARDQYRIVPLEPAWDDRVKHAIRHGHNVTNIAHSKLSFDLKPSDLARLVPAYSATGHHDNWLNDESINAYMELLAAHGRQSDRPTQETPSHHAFNTFFYPKLRTEGPKAISRWAKRAKLAGQNLLACHKIFIPINQSYHWTLAVLSGTQRKITVYNSLGSASNPTVAANILAFVRAELGSAFNESEWRINAHGQSVQQTNADDCGVFMLTNARQLVLEKVPFETYRAVDVPCQRKRIVAELVAGRLLKAGEGVDGKIAGR